VIEFTLREKTIPVGISSAADVVKVDAEKQRGFLRCFFRLISIFPSTERV
jgi:hypothetical protein